MRRFGSEFLVPMLSLVVLSAYAQGRQLRTMDEIKTWHLQVGLSEVDVKLSSFAQAGRPQNTVVSFALADGNPVLTVGQIADLVGQALKEMPDLGYEPAKLQRIAFPSWSTDLESGINRAVVRSGDWKKNCVGHYTCYSVEHVVSDYLRSSKALRPLETVLKMNHLERTNISIDDPVCGFVPKSRRGAVDVGTQHLSCGGLILVDLRSQ